MTVIKKVKNVIQRYCELEREDTKYSYMIVKPNGERHLKEIISIIRHKNINIEGIYKIDDYEYVNMLLHPEKEKHKYIIPINRVYKDFFSNYGILILISKAGVTYKEFADDIVKLKVEIRSKYDYDYIAYILNVSKIGMPYNGETVKIISKSYLEVAKQKMNEKGSYLIISINEIHSPDSNVENTIQELALLLNYHIISENNIVPQEVIEKIERYGTFSFLQDLQLE